ncbi:uncharacterized protein LOC135844432 [Planococcus citri]|uniref:uncharacterized protein LOC135844432 n=1 Tax=Planococcus citri TaxID=170843 RepID=UPI0031F9A734
MTLVKQEVCRFFEDDEVSLMSPSKSDQIVFKKVKKQKRFLTNSLQYLYTKFCEKSSFNLAFSTFCKLRPFWVVEKKVGDRDTCLCVKCENAKLMCKQLRRLNIVNEENIDKLIKNEMLCDPVTEACRFRKCASCCEKAVSILPFDGSEECFYDSWESAVEIGRDQKQHRRTAKQRIYCTKRELVVRFSSKILPAYLEHVATDYHQKEAIRELKKNLTTDELLIHVDFAENYSCKYATEIQSIHFGGNRSQVTIHTGVAYSLAFEKKKKAFCTISDNLTHSPAEIFGHLKPILQAHVNVKRLHVLSDSPATQYRNRYMFYIMLNHIIPMFNNLEHFTWNYSEAGHRKGAPDGIGATLKRTCDKIVAQNNDISNFAQFSTTVIDQIKNIDIISVDPTGDIGKEDLKLFSPAIKGTMKVHQVRWWKDEKRTLYFNTMSCFECIGQCVHYHRTKQIYYDHANDNTEPSEDKEVIASDDKVAAGNDEALAGNDEASASNDDVTANDKDEPLMEDDYVIVEYKLEEENGIRKWIGKIMRVNENDTYHITFLRSKATKFHPGFIYTYPNKPDEDTVYKTQIISRIPPPIKFQRCLKFSVHCDDLK